LILKHCWPSIRRRRDRQTLTITEIAAIARNRRERENQIPAMSAIPRDSDDLHRPLSSELASVLQNAKH